MSFVAIIAGVAAAGGLALTAKGQSDAKKAQKKALSQEQNNYEDMNAENWRRYMMTRGVDTNTGKAINTKLPLWATVKRSQ